MSHPATDYFELAAKQAQSYRDRVVGQYEPIVRVRLTVIGPDNQTRVPCGEASFPRCDADVFFDGILTITSQDDGFVMREYRAGQWTEATAFDAFGHISYHLTPATRRHTDES